MKCRLDEDDLQTLSFPTAAPGVLVIAAQPDRLLNEMSQVWLQGGDRLRLRSIS